MSVPAATARPFETTRLQLRGLTDTEADARLLFELDSDPEVMRYLGPFKLPDVEAYRERLRTVWLPYYTTHPNEGFWSITEKATSKFSGWIFLRAATEYKFAAEASFTRPSEIELGYRLRRAAWSRGLATEASQALVRQAFANPAVTAVVATALVPNRASTRVMEKVGMKRVREFAIPGFEAHSVVYAIPRDGGSLP